MNKALKIAIAVGITVLVAVICVIVVMPYYKDISMHIGKPVDATDHYIESITMGARNPSSADAQMMDEICDTCWAFYLDFIQEHKEDKYHIEVNPTIEKGKTLITYTGTITDNKTGETEIFEETYIFDFIITRDIQEGD